MGLDVYNQYSAVSDDPYILIQKLYEGLLKFLGFVKYSMQEQEIEQKFEYINRSIAIFDELRNVLDFDGGDVAYYLDGLYLYQIETLFTAGINDDLEAIDQVVKVTQGLIEAWNEEIEKAQ